MFRHSPTPVHPANSHLPALRRRKLEAPSYSPSPVNPASLHSAAETLSSAISMVQGPEAIILQKAQQALMALTRTATSFQAANGLQGSQTTKCDSGLRVCPVCKHSLAKRVRLGLLANHINSHHTIRDKELVEELSVQGLVRCGKCGEVIPRITLGRHFENCDGQRRLKPPTKHYGVAVTSTTPLATQVPRMRSVHTTAAAGTDMAGPEGLERDAQPPTKTAQPPRQLLGPASGVKQGVRPRASAAPPPPQQPQREDAATGAVAPIHDLLPRMTRRGAAAATATNVPPAAPPRQAAETRPRQQAADRARDKTLPNFQEGDVDAPQWPTSQWPSWRKVAREATGDWRRVIAQCVTTFVAAVGTPAEGCAIVELLGAVKHLLPVSRSDRRRDEAKAQVHRLRHPVPVASVLAWNAAPRQGQPRANEDNDLWRLRRADELASMGALRKATQTLLSKESLLDSSDADVQQTLRGLHPGASGIPPELPAEWSGPTISPRMVKDAIRNRLPRGSAPGVDGWTTEHLLALIDDAFVMRGISMVIQRICDGSLSGPAKDVLTAARLLAFPKPNGKVRPIAIQSIWLRLAEQVALAAVHDSPAEILSKTQFGVGRGTESAIRLIRKGLSGVNDALLQLDMVNAFNTVRRDAVVKEVYGSAALKPLWGVVNLCYGSCSKLRLFDKNGGMAAELLSQEGVRQGSVLGPLLFSMAIDPVLRRMEVADITHAAYLDDIALVLPKVSVKAVFEELVTELGEVGLRFNLGVDKTQVLCRDDGSAPMDMGPVHVRHDFVRFLGSPIGFDEAKMAEYASKVAAEHTRMFELLPGLLPVNARKIMEVGGASRMVHLLRTTPPGITEEAAADFDTLMHKSLATTLGLDPGENLSDESVLLAGQPLRLGGLGVRWCGHMHGHAFAAAETETIGAQHDLADAKVASIEASLKAHLNPQQKCLHRACCEPTSQKWLRDPPRQHQFPLAPDAAASAMRRRCLVVERAAANTKCSCGNFATEGSRHVLHCFHHGRTRAHDAVTMQLYKALRQLGLAAEHEPRNGVMTQERPDIEYVHKGQLVYVDATIICAGANSYVDSTTTSSNCTAVDVAERQKIRQNVQFAATNGARFVPFAMESQGGVGRLGVKWLHEVAWNSGLFPNAWEVNRWVDGVIANCQAVMLNWHHQAYVDMQVVATPGLSQLRLVRPNPGLAAQGAARMRAARR